MARIVMKFGGTSMAGIERIRNVAGRVKREAEAGNEVLVVVSAMAGETDRLVQLCREAAALHDPKEYDVVVASGEQVTAGLLAMTLQNMGLAARSFMGWQLVKASGVHGNARVDAIERGALDEALKSGTVAVIPGFQGVSEDGRVATLGRGGSDTSAVAIAAGIGAGRCDIYTDVDGVYTTDPRIVPKAQKLSQVTFEEMLELAGVGAKVLQTRSVGLAMRENLPLRVLSAFEDLPGTEIVAELGADMERNAIAGIAADRNEARITLTGIADRPGMVAAVITPLAEAAIAVDMIVHAATAGEGRSDLTFTVPRAAFCASMTAIACAKARTERPFGVNLITMHPMLNELIDTCAKHRVSHVVLAGGLPPGGAIDRIKASGARLICFAPALSLARKLTRSGADALVIEGMEAGGHIGPVSTSVLAQEILPHIARDVPVFVAGGIGRGEAIAAYLEMGAVGVQLGTRFVCAHESIAHPNFKKAFIRASARDAIPSVQIDPRLPVIPVRALKNREMENFAAKQREVAQKLDEGAIAMAEAQLQIEHYWAGALRRAVIDGDVESGSVMAGQSVGMVNREEPVAAIIQELADEAAQALENRG